MLSTLAALALGSLPAPAPTCATASRNVESVIASKAAELGGHEYCQFRIYETLSDVDGDGIEDFLVVFSIEGAHGNDLKQFLAVFPSATRWAPAVIEVGGRGTRLAEGITVVKGEIVLRTSEYEEGDAMCCPSGHGESRYRLRQGRVEPAATS